MEQKIKFGGKFYIECRDSQGNLKWKDEAKNLVPNAALQDILDAYFPAGASAGPTNVYVGLTAGSPTPAAGDTMASHAGWTENQDYSEAARQTYTDVRTNQTVSNTAAKAVFSINGTTTIGGAFLTTNSTKGGTTGILICAAAFSGGNRSAQSGDTMNVQYDFTAADDGV